MHIRLLSLAALSLAHMTFADVVNINPTKDNTIYQAANGGISNGRGDYLFTGVTRTGVIHRALLAFNIAANVPAGAQITDATLYLTMSRWAGGFPSAYLHALASDWGEGTSNATGEEGRGTTATVGDATWTKAFHGTPGVLWSTPGGSFLPAVDAQIDIDGGVTTVFAITSPALISRVQSWQANPASNFGWIITGMEEFPITSIRFNSLQNPVAASRPRLKITYHCPADFNNNGTIDFFDYLDFVDAFSNNLPEADFNGDSLIDFFDYLDFVDRYSTGC